MSEIIDLNVWLDAKRKKDIKSFKIKHPAQYACIKELGRKQGAVEELTLLLKELVILEDESKLTEISFFKLRKKIIYRLKELQGVVKNEFGRNR